MIVNVSWSNLLIWWLQSETHTYQYFARGSQRSAFYLSPMYWTQQLAFYRQPPRGSTALSWLVPVRLVVLERSAVSGTHKSFVLLCFVMLSRSWLILTLEHCNIKPQPQSIYLCKYCLDIHLGWITGLRGFENPSSASSTVASLDHC